MRLRKRVEWDAEKMTIRNAPEAEELVKKRYRKGFEI